MIEGFRHTRRIFGTSAFARHNVVETQPGAAVNTDGEIEHFTRTMGSSLYHPVGTCEMGTDPKAVVDPLLKVAGLEGLRVVDASIMPYTTTGNPQRPDDHDCRKRLEHDQGGREKPRTSIIKYIMA